MPKKHQYLTDEDLKLVEKTAEEESSAAAIRVYRELLAKRGFYNERLLKHTMNSLGYPKDKVELAIRILREPISSAV